MSATILAAIGRLPLRLVLPVLLLLFSIISISINFISSTATAEKSVRERAETRLVQRLTQMQRQFEYFLRNNQIELVQAELGALGSDATLMYAMLTDQEDNVIASMQRLTIGGKITDFLEKDFATSYVKDIAPKVRGEFTGQIRLLDHGSTLVASYPVNLITISGGLRAQEIGILYVKNDLASTLQQARRAEEFQALQGAATMGAAVFLLWLCLHYGVAKRVERLLRLAERYAAGQLDARNPLRGSNELAVVGRALENMADDISEREARLRERERQLRGALQAARMVTWRWDLASGVVTWSTGARELLGIEMSASSCLYDRYMDIVHADDRERLTAASKRAFKEGIAYQIEHRIVLPDGALRWLMLRGEAERGADGKVGQLHGLVWDISEQKTAEDALFEAKERAEVTLHSIGDGVITTDARGRVAYVNPVGERLTGWTSTEAAGRPLQEVFYILNEYSHTIVENPVERVLREGVVVGLANHTVLVKRDGGEVAIEDSAAPIRDRGGAITGVVLVFHDVTQSREMAQKLSWQATHDSLTGLVNRREFENRLAMTLAGCRKDGSQHALLYVDLDQFKLVNDTSGHAAGDELLKQLSTLIQNRLRAADILARLGGDEFGILLENCPLSRAEQIAETVRNIARDFRFAWDKRTFEISASIGVVAITADSGDLTSLLSAADMACYAAKESGRNRIHVYRESDSNLKLRHGEMLWVSEINNALANDNLVLYRQRIEPSQSTSDGFGMIEILVRMRGENGELTPPGAFIPAAERYNLMPSIDRWVIKCLCSQYEKLFGPNSDMRVSINLSGATLSDPGFLDFVRAQMRQFGVDPRNICFEITETAAIANLRDAVAFMESLRKLGCQFALDDFGAGLSSFGYLKNLPVDFLKIDGNLVRNVADNPIDSAMVEAINGIGHVMGLHTIAEFVENDEIRRHLTAMGVDYLQGYGVERPVAVA